MNWHRLLCAFNRHCWIVNAHTRDAHCPVCHATGRWISGQGGENGFVAPRTFGL